mmetsp:Transcript_11412/g.30810  ORF Transcript_11412/g.30810 Transcript_11412/m.30810 type:complete len:231 (-) Transcript_11412:1222-1914(-)
MHLAHATDGWLQCGSGSALATGAQGMPSAPRRPRVRRRSSGACLPAGTRRLRRTRAPCPLKQGRPEAQLRLLRREPSGRRASARAGRPPPHWRTHRVAPQRSRPPWRRMSRGAATSLLQQALLRPRRRSGGERGTTPMPRGWAAWSGVAGAHPRLAAVARRARQRAGESCRLSPRLPRAPRVAVVREGQMARPLPRAAPGRRRRPPPPHGCGVLRREGEAMMGARARLSR